MTDMNTGSGIQRAANTTPPRSSEVDDMAQRLALQLKEHSDERTMLRNERETITNRIKWLDAEIDKAERMTKALIPRHRQSSSSKNGQVD